MTEKAAKSGADLHSIGDVADATGITVDTIRVWERRYGRPVPVRLPSGHRRYTDEDMRWVRRIAEALSLGHRPAAVIPLDDGDLDELLRAGRKSDEAQNLKALLDLVGDFRGKELYRALEADADSLGPRAFLETRIAPLLSAVGGAWADGSLEIRHEHFVTAILQDLLTVQRRSIPESKKGPYLLLATLSGELHGLGLLMAAMTASLAGLRPRILGTSTPNAEIVAAAEEIEAIAVAVSVSLATGGVKTDRVLRSLREQLPERVALIVGGRGARGARRGPRGIIYVSDLGELEACLNSL